MKNSMPSLQEIAAVDSTLNRWLLDELVESENRYRAVVEDQTELICRFAPDGTLTFVNDAYCRYFGLDRKDCIGKRHTVVLPPEDDRKMRRHLKALTLDNPVAYIVHRIIMPSEEVLWHRWSDRVIFDKSGTVEEYQSVGQDITDVVQAEDALRESENRYRAVVEDQTELICRFTPDGTLTFVNDAYCRYFGLDRKDCIGKQHTVVLPPEDDRKMKKHIASLTPTDPVASLRHRIIMPSGEIRWQRWSDRVIFDKSGTVKEYQSVGRDITDVIQAEDALHESEKKYRTLVETLKEGIWMIDRNSVTTYVNPRMAEMLGYPADGMIGKHLFSFMDDNGREAAEKNLESRKKGIREQHDFEFVKKDGERIYTSLETTPILSWDGEYAGAIAAVADISERRMAEKALRESEEHYRQLVEMSPDAILVLNDSKIMEINSAALSLVGASSPGQLVGESFTSLVHPGSKKTFEKWIRRAMDRKKPVSPHEQKIVQLNGTILDIEVTGVPITYKGRQAVQIIARDITQRKMLEDQVKHQQEILEKQVQERTIDLLRANEQLKMEVVERKAMQEELTLASNEKDLLLREIHHRVKNNLQLIIGLIDMTKLRTHDTTITAVLTDIMAKIHTMGLIHTRLYESKRFDKINMKQQVAELVDMTSGFYSHDHCTIDFTLDCAEIYLPVDQAMPCALALNEVLSNIHKHAFKGRRSGVVEISSSRKHTKLRFIISDDGVGLPKGFDIEQSNRLGLKLMRALVEQQLHGSLLIKSENGTRVVIEIPLAQGETDHGKSTRS